ncbi:(2Fe-2S)-binding protein [Litorilituus lipolyticus]|uniref:Bacterioferritin-associated ferredoxin n=1 Tax=Litorilituus lipolyticus TaxID=2491017 RepID=A0A502L6D7_9GAMM|nr:(2Fe-2S)-binding protein [Litorilituus lipolyticus]TPH19256.1 bacterioferritin [Litorilituus lipolyticus]
MYVCLCHGITDSQIESAIDNGAHSMKQISQELSVGSQCGKCCQCTKKVLSSKLMQISEAQPAAA